MSLEEADSFVSTKSLPTGFWKFLVSAFIVVYFSAVYSWLFLDKIVDQRICELCKDINILDGATQHWSLFSPHVRHVIYHESATITFKDGSVKYYEFPRMEKLDHTEKFVHEKLRKVFSDCIPWPGYKQFLPDITSYLAAANQDSKNPPTIISMIMNSSSNPPPDPAHWNYRDRLPPHTDKAVTFVYTVRENDLSKKNDSPERTNPKVLDE